ncbi:hypothetical protein HUJ04_013328 [Dendroctonus ponderosae]|nr:hypothetical protein HUJ04_013328 [Dendroctonus ponderosae]
MSGEPHLGPPTPHDSSNSTPVSKSAFIELQQHGYGPLRTSYQHHFNSPAGNAHSGPPGAHDTGFPSPRGALGAYPFPPMHQNSYTGYHLGSYASNCPPSPKDDVRFLMRATKSQLFKNLLFILLLKIDEAVRQFSTPLAESALKPFKTIGTLGGVVFGSSVN